MGKEKSYDGNYRNNQSPGAFDQDLFLTQVIYRKMAFFSRDFRLGFGSYVDKTVSPYISIHPERIHNQCRYLILDMDFLMLNKFKTL